jgi:hypothetical protein
MDCEANAALKLAAAATGSHEILNLLFAKGKLTFPLSF